MATSPYDVRLLALWNGRHVSVSTDEGRSFRRVLDGAGGVSDAAFDCHGRLHVVRGDGLLGVLDDGDPPVERWTRAGTFHDPESDDCTWGCRSLADERLRLVVEGSIVAVVGADSVDPTRLMLARVDRRGRWRMQRFFEEPGEYRSKPEIAWIDRTSPGHFRALAVIGGDCGYEHYYEIVLDLQRGASRWRDRGSNDDRYRPFRRSPEPPGDEWVVRDAAGRWVGLDDSGRRIQRRDLTRAVLE